MGIVPKYNFINKFILVLVIVCPAFKKFTPQIERQVGPTVAECWVDRVAEPENQMWAGTGPCMADRLGKVLHGSIGAVTQFLSWHHSNYKPVGVSADL